MDSRSGGMPSEGLYASTSASKFRYASMTGCGVRMSGWPMLRWWMRMPRCFAASASGVSLRMGERGTAPPLSDSVRRLCSMSVGPI